MCYGDIGTNLYKLLLKLNSINSDIFNSNYRYDYPILNSYTIVYPNTEYSYKIESDYDKIDEDENLEKLSERIKGKEYSICFGNCAEHMMD